MGKTIRLTEEQIRRFFGEGFGRRLIGEASKKKEERLSPEEEAKKFDVAVGHSQTGTTKNRNYKYDDNYDVRGQEDDYGYDERPASQTGFHQIERGGTSKDYPGHHGAWIKMHDLGGIGVGAKKKGEIDEFKNGSETDVYIKRLFELNGNSPVNIIDAIDILQQVKEGNVINGVKITNEDVKNLLDTLSIQTIFSNYLNLRADKYIYNRLMLLSKEELKTIKDLYGRDFTGWGTKCDACGITKWKTTISPFEHDDAHVNLEYMGAGGSEKKTGGGFAIREEAEGGSGSRNPMKNGFTTYTLPFEIHHMNEVAGDNNPLNLACLCPNCHSLAGSTNKNKRAINAVEFDFIKDNAVINPDDGSIAGNMDEEQKRKLAEDLKAQNLGYYNAQVSDEFIYRQAELCGIEPDELDKVSDQIFNMLYVGCKKAFIDANTKNMSIDANALKESVVEPDDKHGEGDEAVEIQNIGQSIPIKVSGKTEYIVVGVAAKGKWIGAKISLFNGENRGDYRALASNMMTVNYIYYGNEQNNEEFKKSIKLDILNLFKKRYDSLEWAADSIKRRDNGKDTVNVASVERMLSNSGSYDDGNGGTVEYGAEELNRKYGDVPGREVRNMLALKNPDPKYVPGSMVGHEEYNTEADKRKMSSGDYLEYNGEVYPSRVTRGIFTDLTRMPYNPDKRAYMRLQNPTLGWNVDNLMKLHKNMVSGVTPEEMGIEVMKPAGRKRV